MEQIYFEEKQKLSRVWVWIILMVVLAMTFPLDRMLYINLILNEETRLSTRNLVALLSLLLISVGVGVWLAAVFHLDVKIRPSGIYYRYFPHHAKPRLIERQSIVSYEIRKIELKEFIQSRRDRRPGRSNGNQVLTVYGDTVLELVLVGGRKIILGTSDKENVSRAMKKLLDNPES